MFVNERIEPLELTNLRFLKTRMKLPDKYYYQYRRLQRGFEGEQAFDEMMKKKPGNFLVVRNLLLELNNTKFQIDSAIIFRNRNLLVDVKNYEGDYSIDGDNWYANPDEEINNPLSQLKRSDTLFRKLLKSIGYSTSIDSRLVFVNPHFFLYNAQRNHPIIFPSQIDRFLDKLALKTANLTEKQHKLAKHLLEIQADEKRFMQLPDYTYTQLTKGIRCSACNLFYDIRKGKKVICQNCGCIEDVQTSVMRSVKELNILFPDKQITTNIIKDWCKIVSLRTIQRILTQNFEQVGHGKSTYYLSKKE
ncbi:NERD domain-containing protein [Alkalihalobacillus sp. AL-G]|uniref:NERD domain-containing protein n=1 Tax=Alkalihalobacillus sp. AL-G TaxID=2926399 RepID=UPI00272A40D7|nr:NERD domain-containing protein [Alkalihalobacillus sp. AL-G]WLD93045.1 NERD domain-containing protein [Alkalihalobacillus sp. AL-G]